MFWLAFFFYFNSDVEYLERLKSLFPYEVVAHHRVYVQRQSCSPTGRSAAVLSFPILLAENQMSKKYFESKKSISEILHFLGKNLSTL